MEGGDLRLKCHVCNAEAFRLCRDVQTPLELYTSFAPREWEQKKSEFLIQGCGKPVCNKHLKAPYGVPDSMYGDEYDTSYYDEVPRSRGRKQPDNHDVCTLCYESPETQELIQRSEEIKAKNEKGRFYCGLCLLALLGLISGIAALVNWLK